MKFETKEECFNWLKGLQEIDLDKIARRFSISRTKDAYGFEARGSFLMRIATAMMEGKHGLEEAEPEYEEKEEEERGEKVDAEPPPPKEAEERDFLSALSSI